MAFLVARMVKNLPAMQETWVGFLGWEDPWRIRKWQPTPLLFPEEFHGQRSLKGYSPLDSKESDTTERLSLGELYHKLCFTAKIKTFNNNNNKISSLTQRTDLINVLLEVHSLPSTRRVATASKSFANS